MVEIKSKFEQGMDELLADKKFKEVIIAIGKM